jgi:hypothetical protein
MKPGWTGATDLFLNCRGYHLNRRDAEALSEAHASGDAAGMSAWREDYHQSLLKLFPAVRLDPTGTA